MQLYYPTPKPQFKDAQYETYLNAVNATNLEELRKVDTTTLITANLDLIKSAQFPNIVFGQSVAIDGAFVQDAPIQLLRQGRFDKNLNILIGANSNEVS